MYVFVGKVSGGEILDKVTSDPKIIVDILGSKTDNKTLFNRNNTEDDAMLFNFKYNKDNYLVIVTKHEAELYKQIHNVSNDSFIQWKDVSDACDGNKYKDRTLSGLVRVGKFKFNLQYNVCKDWCLINMMFDNGNRTKEITNGRITSGVTNDSIKKMIIDMIREYTLDVLDSAMEIVDFD